ncbi:DUF4043 family protein [Pseudomonas aeruginosa]|uniref:DUF4043 family protein n=1 Tax=Pseudomonas aeruginosa TaxID=287 RepID=UPI0021A500D5|nr:DUF4043 family protein [Pseudomonas aeruginosa]MCT2416068.1 DUF4043 family protein [Pseudomonas aeruginosa]
MPFFWSEKDMDHGDKLELLIGAISAAPRFVSPSRRPTVEYTDHGVMAIDTASRSSAPASKRQGSVIPALSFVQIERRPVMAQYKTIPLGGQFGGFTPYGNLTTLRYSSRPRGGVLLNSNAAAALAVGMSWRSSSRCPPASSPKTCNW